jgi:TonB family protein
MNELRRITLTAIGASAVLHLGIAGVLCLHIGVLPIRSGPVSALQVRLADSLEADPPSAGNRKAFAPNQKRATARFHRTKTVTPTPSQPEREFETVIPSVQLESKSDFPSPNVPAEADGVALSLPASVTSDEEGGEDSDGTNRSNEMAQFLQDVRSRLESAKRYPWLARMRGQEGTARVQFLIDTEGEIRDVRLLESSRSRILDDEAVETVRRVGRLPQLPATWTKAVQLQVPIVFELRTP